MMKKQIAKRKKCSEETALKNQLLIDRYGTLTIQKKSVNYTAEIEAEVEAFVANNHWPTNQCQ